MGGKQLGFSDYELTTAKKQTKREKFLAEMESVVPWVALLALMSLNGRDTIRALPNRAKAQRERAQGQQDH